MKEVSFLTFLKKYYLYILLFFISTISFLYQHFSYRSWDFIVYVLNAKYLLGEGVFFEAFRSPLISIIMGIISLFFSWNLTEYIYIIIVSLGFAVSTYFLAKELNFNPLIFYIFSLSFFILLEGLFNGTELLTFVLIEFALLFILRQSFFAGIFIGLAALSKTTAFLFFLLLLFQFKLRTIIYSFLAGVSVVSIWLMYSKIIFGSFFYSIVDQYAQTFSLLTGLQSSLNPTHFLVIIGFLFPFFITGLILVIKGVIRELRNNKIIIQRLIKLRIKLLFLFLLLLTIFLYVIIPLKFPKDLLYLTLPVIYFSYYGFNKIISFIREDIKKYVLVIVLICLLILNFGSYLTINYFFNPIEAPSSVLETLEHRELSNCLIYSNNWPYLNDNGYLSRPLPDNKEHLRDLINNNGAVVILFYAVNQPEYTLNKSYVRSLPIIEHHENEYTLISNVLNSCEVEEEFIFSYLEITKENLEFNRKNN